MASSTKSPPDHDADERRSWFARHDLSVPKLAGGALASVTTAVMASFFGVAGTFIGAALGSVVSSVAATVYVTSLQTAGSRIRGSGSDDSKKSPAGADPKDPTRVPDPYGAMGQPAPSFGATAALAPSSPPTRHRPRRPRSRSSVWQPVMLMTGFVFLVAMGAISGTELFLGHPISDSERTGSTVSQIVAPKPAKKTSDRDHKPSVSSTKPSSSATSSAGSTEDGSPTGSASESPEKTTGTSRETDPSSTENGDPKDREDDKSGSDETREPAGDSDKDSDKDGNKDSDKDKSPVPTGDKPDGGSQDQQKDEADTNG
jgi:hypothetical protein